MSGQPSTNQFQSSAWVNLIGPNYNEGFAAWAQKGVAAGLDEEAITNRWRTLEQSTQREPMDGRVMHQQFEWVKTNPPAAHPPAAQPPVAQPPVDGPSQQPAQGQTSDIAPYTGEKVQDYLLRALATNMSEDQMRNRWVAFAGRRRGGTNYSLSDATWAHYMRSARTAHNDRVLMQRSGAVPLPQIHERIQHYVERAILAGGLEAEIRARWAAHREPLTDYVWAHHYREARSKACRRDA